ncbi:MAG: tRNA uridine-5-carboxymethylaminomethyl(34) synthesis GTPase MnmE [Cyanobacteria bacterium REEB65]|nr:tRNA uridine-5-carboxymethylaminomethyl(34) synthesis GTPase MnmE [Cyanobacteria bacterium REEB65]
MFDTIAAIATPPGVGAIAVIRVSGPEAIQVASTLFHGQGQPIDLSCRGLHVGWIVDPVTGDRIDQVVLLVFPGPKSFTTEDVIEIQGHGGQVVTQRLLTLVLSQGARLAAPGEFTKRAFLGGRLDLAQAEGLLELVEARGERALQAAVGQLEGRLSREIRGIRDFVLEILARVEASVDFPDDVGEVVEEELAAALAAAGRKIQGLRSGAAAFELARQGARVAFVGQPNVGKSSLLNAMVGRERAIVTPIAGTTRDVLEVEVEIRGIPIRLIDMAGIREATDAIEAEGVLRSREQLSAAELRVLVYDASVGVTAAERELLAVVGGRPTVLAANKVDLLKDRGGSPPVAGAIALSAKTGEGLSQLEEAIARAVMGGGEEASCPVGVNARHRAALDRAAARLEAAQVTLGEGQPRDLLSGDLRAAAVALGAIAGVDLNEEILDLLFSRFCVGK